VAVPADDTSIASPGLSVEVLVAGALFAASAGVTGLSALAKQDPPSALLLLGWPVLAVVGGVLLDVRPGSAVGRSLAAASAGSVVAVLWSLLRFGASNKAADLAAGTGEIAALLACAVAITVPWAFRSPYAVRLAIGLAVLAGLGSLLVLVARAGAWAKGFEVAGWALAALGTVGVWVLVARTSRDDDRASRRRVGSVLALLAAGLGAVAVAWTLGPGNTGYYATCGSLMIGAISIAGLTVRTDFRPLDEHLLDLGLLLGVVVSAAITATLVHVGSDLAHQPSTNTTTVFTALLTTAMAAPAALWVRRAVLARRYGSGLIAPEDVALITADLHTKTEPRDLLDNAARMVAAASGSTEARIVLGDDDPGVPEHWTFHPLVVGGDRVGALLIDSAHPEGPEARQERVVAQLLPTVALVARAVGLAVEAEHARRDVARERAAERKRVMGDLHDGLGPALAGMSMRVQANLRTTTSPEYAALLADLAEGLATSRADLRRIVAGIAPSTLDDGNLEGALGGLVASFQGATDTPKVGLTVVLDEPVAPDVQVAIYRSVAEGITNGLRHAAATTIEVSVRAREGRVLVDVSHDGGGGPVVPGVGLSSLARRAESLGGQMTICPGDPGTTLHLDLPTAAEEAS
jgi:signal transduction histidine kinase